MELNHNTVWLRTWDQKPKQLRGIPNSTALLMEHSNKMTLNGILLHSQIRFCSFIDRETSSCSTADQIETHNRTKHREWETLEHTVLMIYLHNISLLGVQGTSQKRKEKDFKSQSGYSTPRNIGFLSTPGIIYTWAYSVCSSLSQGLLRYVGDVPQCWEE